MLLILTIASAAAVLALFTMLLYYVYHITETVDRIGGRGDSYLAKIRLGLRAIETETGHLPGNVASANEGLTQIRDGLKVIDSNLQETAEAAMRQDVK